MFDLARLEEAETALRDLTSGDTPRRPPAQSRPQAPAPAATCPHLERMRAEAAAA